MALTAQEEQELAQLEREVQPQGLTPAEEQELAQLEKETTPVIPIENDIHPELEGLKGLKVRTVYKALGADPEASFNYLQKEYPNLQWEKDPEGEIVVATPGENKKYRLDPKGLDIRDVTDLAYDIPAGIAQGVATAGVGLLGAPAGGVGAIPAAMAGSAVSGAGLEAIRNQMGQMMGIDQSQSWSDIGVAGGVGAVAPLLLGTGASAAQAGKLALKEGAKQTAKDILQTQRGVLGRGYDAAAGTLGPHVASLISGENKQIIKQAAKMLPEIKAADTNPKVLAAPLQKIAKDVSAGIREKTKAVGSRLDEIRGMIDNQPGLVPVNAEGVAQFQGTIDAKPFVQPFQELIQDLTAKASTDSDKVRIAELQKLVQDEFTGMPEFMTAAQVESKIQQFKEIAEDYGKKYGNVGSAKSSSVAGISGRVGDAFESSRKKMSQGIVDRLEQMDGGLADEYAQTRQAYGDLKKLSEEHAKDFKSAKSVRNFLNRATSNDIDASQLEDLQLLTGVDLSQAAKESKAIQTFSKPKTEIRSLGGVTSTTRSAPASVAGGAAGYAAGQAGGFSPFIAATIGALGGSKLSSPAAIRKYMEMNALMRELPQDAGMLYQALPYTAINAKKNNQK